LGTSSPSSYDRVDEALFDAALVPNTGDVRSVGEMLVDVDFLARQLLMDVTGDDAAQLLRGWHDVVEAADDLLGTFPGPTVDDPARELRDRPMTRLNALAGGITVSVRTSRWPGEGPVDARMVEIACSLARAADLVRVYGAEIPHHRADVAADLEAAQARIMHGLYVTAHAITVALHQRGRDLHSDSVAEGRPIRLSGLHSPYTVGPIAGWIQRLGVCENLISRQMAGGFAHSAGGEADLPVEDPARLPRALATWDIQSHRTLATEPSAANIVLAARTQGLIAGCAVVLVDAADRAELLPTPAAKSRVVPAIEHAGRAWSHLASRWSDLTPPGARLHPALATAANEIRAACRELTHDKVTLASPETITARAGIDRAVTAMLQALDSSAELAHVVDEQAARPDLVGPARPLSIRAHNDVEAAIAARRMRSDTDVVWVSPADVLAGRIVRLPKPVADGLTKASAQVIDATVMAASAATAAWPAGHPTHDLARLSSAAPRPAAPTAAPATAAQPPRR